MLRKALLMAVYGGLFGSLLVVDHLLGNGFSGMLRKNYCKIFCFVKKTLREQAYNYQAAETRDVNFVVLFVEIIALCSTMMILNKYKKYRLSRIDEGDMNSKKNQRLEKMSRYHQMSRSSGADSPIKFLDLEQTLGPTRNQAERGDGGDLYHMSTSTIDLVVSPVSSLLMESISEDEMDVDESYPVHFNNHRYLWDVIEEE